MSAATPFLLVTDDAAVSSAVDAALGRRQLGATVCTPVKCVVAAAALPEIVLVDLGAHLPWKRILGALLAEPRTRGIPLVGVARAADAGNVLPVVAGMHDVLVLPIDDASLDRLASLRLMLQYKFGAADGTPGSAAADRLLWYAEANALSGTLSHPARGDRATFTNGLLTECRAGGLEGTVALASLLSQPGDLSFEQAGASAAIEELEEILVLEEVVEDELVLEPVPEPPKSGNPPLVLAVDDDESISGLVEAFLTKEGFRVVTAADGEDGYRMALEVRPDAIVSDLEMPVLDGWGFLRKVRGDHRLADTPLVFLSAAESFRMSMQASSAGAQDYISKGSARNVLSSRLKSILAPRRELEEALGAGRPARSRVELVGAKWSLVRFAQIAPRGSVLVSDGFGVYELSFENGNLRSADAMAGAQPLTGRAAFEAYLRLRAGDIAFGHAIRRNANFTAPIGETAELAANHLNREESLLVTRALASPGSVRVDRAQCELYVKFGPMQGRAVAAALAAGSAPFQLMMGTRNPVETEAILRDLARRGVIQV